MNRPGAVKQECSDRLVERNLRQRIILLSFFVLFLVFVDCIPLLQFFDSKPRFFLSLRQIGTIGTNTTWQLWLTPKETSARQGSVLFLTDRHSNLAPLADVVDDCSITPEFAPFFDLAMDINRAQLKDLTLLPGIGPVLGQRIVAEREKNGPYESPEALLRVAGIGVRTFSRLQPHVCTR